MINRLRKRNMPEMTRTINTAPLASQTVPMAVGGSHSGVIDAPFGRVHR